MSILKNIFGSQNERYLKSIQHIVDKINLLEPSIKQLKDEELKQKTKEFKSRLSNEESLDDILPEAYAVVREAAWRILGQRHYDVQLIGGIALHHGNIAEMKTGEGKTLASTLPIYLNALTGDGVHVVTVNDYLAQRDSEWMGPIFEFLGLNVGVIVNDMDNDERKINYARDITYGTNNEFGFDYLRDNMVRSNEDKVQRGFNYCVVDEIDSVLIDEARTPLIISGGAENDAKYIINAKKLLKFFKECEKNSDGRYPDEADPLNPQKPVGDFKIDEKAKSISFSDDGMDKLDKLLKGKNLISGSLYDQENFEYVHYMTQALKAEYLFHNEVDYIVKNNEVLIVDEHTGRVLSGRRYSEGLHQAIEAKENITIQRRSKTFASITFQNFFRMYKKLSGMTGTADTEAAEFKNIYSLNVIVIPTNKPIVRNDHSDIVYLSFKEKAKAILEEIKELHKKGQPILVGTISVEKSEFISSMLKKAGVRHNVLNAKNHSREANIIAEAGKVGAITIATNMAGRGTDIKLGGDNKYDEEFEEILQDEIYIEKDREILLSIKELVEKNKLDEAEGLINSLSDEIQVLAEKIIKRGYDWIEEHKRVLELGGLFVLGTERHESRRIDNQLRGRSGRQGDPGASRFYVSLEDDLMRLFGGDRIQKMLSGLGISEGEKIEHSWINKTIERSQKKVESRNYEIRKHLLEYDDVLNNQRAYIYERRDEILSDNNLVNRVVATTKEIVADFISDYRENMKTGNDYAIAELIKELKIAFYFDPLNLVKQFQNVPDTLEERLFDVLKDEILKKEQLLEKDYFNSILRELYLWLIDKHWQNHLTTMEELRESVRLRAYSQKNPLIEYKLEGSSRFEELIVQITEGVVERVFKIQIESVAHSTNDDAYSYNHTGYNSFNTMSNTSTTTMNGQNTNTNSSNTIVKPKKIGRNDPCPCGSGKKYKNCHGR